MDLLAYLEQERERRGVSMRTFASQLDISHTTYSKILRHKQAPKIETLDKISRALNVPFEKIGELAGYGPGATPDRRSAVQRIDDLEQKNPWVKQLRKGLLRLPRADLEIALAKLEREMGDTTGQ